jgi:O-antigen ligase
MKGSSQIITVLAAIVLAGALMLFAGYRPGYFSNLTIMSGILLLEIAAVAAWHYEKAFFPILMIVFLWAGTDVPLSGAAASARWVFLTVAALAGVLMRPRHSHRKRFGAIPMVAFLCVLSAAVSVMVSSRTQISLLKVVSLALLFLYGAVGARLAVAGREAAFFHGLVAACEAITYLSALLYFVVRFEIFGNANSLGAIMGVVVVPVLLWAVLIAESRHLKRRRTVALCLAGYLLYSSVSRAAILACGLAVIGMCIALHRQKLLLKGAFGLVVLLAALAVLQPQQFGALASSFTDDVIYKGKREQGLLGSRNGPWEDTVKVITASPWFGSGFGTSGLRAETLSSSSSDSMVRTSGDSTITREHGNSYLAIAEYVGLLGIVPFLVLIGLVVRLIYRVYVWMWRTGNPRHYAIPLALICCAGLIHAFFEDWLFAVGYYLNVLFWVSVFVLPDLLPPVLPESVAMGRVAYPRIVPSGGVPLPTAR